MWKIILPLILFVVMHCLLESQENKHIIFPLVVFFPILKNPVEKSCLLCEWVCHKGRIQYS